MAQTRKTPREETSATDQEPSLLNGTWGHPVITQDDLIEYIVLCAKARRAREAYEAKRHGIEDLISAGAITEPGSFRVYFALFEGGKTKQTKRRLIVR